MAVLGGIAMLIVVLTIITGGNFAIGTGPQGPSAQFGFSGPGFRP